MMEFQQLALNVLEELKNVFEKIKQEEIERFSESIINANRIFVIGAGREGLSSRAFAMRLMHLGKPTYWVWDDTTPYIGQGDLLIATSGSGKIISIQNVVRLAKVADASVAIVTGNPEADTAKMADVVLCLPAEVWGGGKDVVHSTQPMGSLFEQGLLILFDLIVITLMEKMGVTASDMAKRHRNVE